MDSTYLNTPLGDFTPSIDYPAGLPSSFANYLESQFVHFNDDNTLGRLFLQQEVILNPSPIIEQQDIFNTINGIEDGLGGLNVIRR